jgi:perosamine synthetase
VDELILPQEMPNRLHSWHLYPIRLKLDCLSTDRAALISEMKNAGIGTSVHWMPLHMHPYYRETLGCAPEDYPSAASIYPQLISLPLYPDLGAQDVEYVCSTLKNLLARSQTRVSGDVVHSEETHFFTTPDVASTPAGAVPSH